MSKKFLRSQLDLLILNELAKRSLHGYGLIDSFRKEFGTYYGPSTIYPLLNSMETEGLIKSRWDLEGRRPRKVYDITERGKTKLESAMPHVLKVLENALKDYMGGNKPSNTPSDTMSSGIKVPER